MNYAPLRTSIYELILNLASEDGINASGKEEIYGCIFGRDSAITILKILKVLQNDQASSHFETYRLQELCRHALIKLTQLQGKESNFESGEEPGKFIHEYRKHKYMYEHLLKLEKPWYVYPDGILRNFDSLDSTPLALIALYNYWKLTQDNEFLLTVLPSVEAGLNWIITYGDRDKDMLVEYELPKTRKFGGLPVQSWTDSHETLMKKDGTMPEYPIAPVEVQGYTWLALKLWADFYSNPNQFANTEQFAQKLRSFANGMKKRFNETFLIKDRGVTFTAQALDGLKNQIKTVTGNPLLLLWATYKENGSKETIIDDSYIPDLVERSFMSDMFDIDAGIRTMSSDALIFNPKKDSYHNGSFWPKLNGMSHEGLINWGFDKKAKLLKEATLKPILFFNSPIELYMKESNGTYSLFEGPTGQVSCRQQAWSAAATLDLLV